MSQMNRPSLRFKNKTISQLEFVIHVAPPARSLLTWLPYDPRGIHLLNFFTKPQKNSLRKHLGIVINIADLIDSIVSIFVKQISPFLPFRTKQFSKFELFNAFPFSQVEAIATNYMGGHKMRDRSWCLFLSLLSLFWPYVKAQNGFPLLHFRTQLSKLNLVT